MKHLASSFQNPVHDTDYYMIWLINVNPVVYLILDLDIYYTFDDRVTYHRHNYDGHKESEKKNKKRFSKFFLTIRCLRVGHKHNSQKC